MLQPAHCVLSGWQDPFLGSVQRQGFLAGQQHLRFDAWQQVLHVSRHWYHSYAWTAEHGALFIHFLDPTQFVERAPQGMPDSESASAIMARFVRINLDIGCIHTDRSHGHGHNSHELPFDFLLVREWRLTFEDDALTLSDTSP